MQHCFFWSINLNRYDGVMLNESDGAVTSDIPPDDITSFNIRNVSLIHAQTGILLLKEIVDNKIHFSEIATMMKQSYDRHYGEYWHCFVLKRQSQWSQDKDCFETNIFELDKEGNEIKQ